MLAAALPATAAPLNLGAWLSPEVGHLDARLSYNAEFHPDREIKGQKADLGYTLHEFKAFAPAWQKPGRELALGVGAEFMPLTSGGRFPSGRALPDELWNLSASAIYRQKLDNGWIAGGFLRIDSASDKPFRSESESGFNASLFLRLPASGKNAWLLLLNYDYNRDFLGGSPIPGAAYWYEPNDQLQALIGLPLANVRYRPLKDLTLTGAYIVPTTLYTRASYRLARPFSVFLGYEMFNDRWWLADRTREENRLFYYQKRGLAGFDYILARGLRLEVMGGYSFDRLMFMGENWGDRDQERVDIADGPFVSGQLSYRF
ncbi:MAG: hypothetical protein V1797_19160 [Pseudomonadota bacterium]